MPSAYAHHRFGAQLIPLMPADVRGPILRNRTLFNIGVHGPDFLFFHHFLKKTPMYRLGSAYHSQSGSDFFTRFCAHFRQEPSEAAFAYLHGVLAHYCLDSGCHPFIYRMTDDTDLDHGELEVEFDRYLMCLDGIKKPHETSINRHIRLKKADHSLIAGFYPEISARDTGACIRNMAAAQMLLTIPHAHGAIVKFTQLAGGNTSGKVMTIGPNPKYSHLNEKILSLYDSSLAGFPAYLEQLNHHLAYNAPFGPLFAPNFDRG